jgi:anaerobic magnesium-protoporphyrin IX monomethyl ester cyclase
LVFPPQWSPNLPSLSLPALSAYLKVNGINVQQHDFNIEVYDKILSPEYLNTIWNRVNKKFIQLDQKSTLLPEEQREYYCLFRADLIGRYRVDEVQHAKAVMRDPKSFYDFNLYRRARLVMEAALQMVTAAYFPSKLTLSTFQTERPLQSSDDFFDVTQEEQENPFIELFEKYFLERLIEEPPHILGISIVGMSQAVPGLTLARLVKSESPQTHVVIGGSVFTETMDQLKGYPEIFGEFFDSVIVYEGEIPLLELCRCLLKRGSLDTVPNLVYKDDGKVKANELYIPESADALPTPCFDGLPLDLYFSPYPILPILSSRGCYWGQCGFCSHGTVYGNRYRKMSSGLVVEDLRVLMDKHSTKYFTFNDEAISPSHLEGVCEAILSSGLEIESTTDLRLDSRLDRNLLQTAYDAGFRVFFFGLESGSDRVLKHMRKGIKIATAKRVLRGSSDSGIWNHVFVFFGFPTETLHEARATMEFVFTNKEIIHSVGHSTFQLGRCSPAMRNPDDFGITAISEDANSFMNLWASYSVRNGLTMEEAEEVAEEFSNRVKDEYDDHFVWSRLAKDHILLYVSHYKTLLFPEFTDRQDRLSRVYQPPAEIELSEHRFPRLKNDVLCGLARFDVPAILLNSGTSLESNRVSNGLFILYDLERGRTVSTTLAAGAILGRCNGRRTLEEIAEELAELFKVPFEETIRDCKAIITSVIEAGLCNVAETPI